MTPRLSPPTETVFDVAYNTVYTPGVSTKWLCGLVPTPTTILEVDSIVLVPRTTTYTDKIDCYPRETMATAPTKTMQSIACAPSNLTGRDDITNESVNPYIVQDPSIAATRDASAYCQLCVGDENCAVMIYIDITNDPYGICRTYNISSSCSFAAAIGRGNQELAQAGCGFLAETSLGVAVAGRRRSTGACSFQYWGVFSIGELPGVLLCLLPTPCARATGDLACARKPTSDGFATTFGPT